MKILAIRGKNLTSLAGEFAVEFAAEPLASAGLFAITGPTGAGKSTLLDALCLALFDRIPRLAGVSGSEVGQLDGPEDERLKSNDVRSILRRGTADGYAEVDFIGQDRRAYRARWEARRARGRASGTLQKQEMRLADLAGGQILASKKTEVLEEIKNRLGLTFEQFRRSSLLAQGDFAAFLKAAPKDRSELLEKITGTEAYHKLSIAAHERARQETEKLKEIQARLGGLQLLEPEDQARLELERERWQAETGKLEAHKRWLDQALSWHQRLSELKQQEAEAQAALAVADQQRQAAEPRRAGLETARQALGLRPLAEQAARLERECQASQAASQQAQARRDALQAELERCRQAALERETAWQHSRAAQQAASPELSEARRLDSRLQEASAALQQAQQDQQQAARRAAQAQAALAQARQQEQAWQQQARTLADQLEKNSAHETLAAQWPRWEDELRRASVALAEIAARQGELENAQGQLRQSGAEISAVEAELSNLQAALARLEEQARSLEQQADQANSEALEQQRTELETRREQLRLELDAAKQARQQQQELAQIQARLAQVQQVLAESAAQERDSGEQLQIRRIEQQEARRAWELWITAGRKEITALRADLREGEPCPLCGSPQHPWAAHAPPVADQQKQRVEQLDAEVASLSRQLAEAGAARAGAERQSAELSPRQQQLQAVLAGIPAVSIEAVAEALNQAQRQLEDLRRQEQQARQQREAATQARRQWQAAQDRRAGLQGRRDELQQQRQPLQERQAQAQARLEQAQRGLRQNLETLAEPLSFLAGWEDQLRQEPQGLARRCQDWAEQRRQQQEQLQALQAQLQNLQPQLATAAENAKHGAEVEAGAAAAAAARQAELTQWQQQRGQCLQGQAADAMEKALAEAEQAARQGLENARKQWNALEQDLAAARQSVAHLQETLAAQQAELAQATANLSEELARHGLSRDDLNAWLQRGDAWLQAEQTALQALDKEWESAQVRLQERGQQRAAHEAAAPPDTQAPTPEQLAEAEQNLRAARQTLAEIAFRLRDNEQKRAQAGELQAELDSQRKHWEVWESLRELIGSSDGSKFRVFAQSLTLDRLLAHANLHLQELARRYALQRAPAGDLELQIIDREMGDEARSVHSLSGGESFLVSLALALGLASLNSRQAQVESLFIDEGFGSLDADTLDTALACLDALQAHGRAVGVISHVPAMLERIGVQVRIEPRGGGRSVVVVARA